MLRCKPETTDKQRLVLTQRFLGVAEKSLARERMKTKRLTVDLGKIEQDHSRLRKHYHTILQQSKETEKAHAELLLAPT